MRKSTVVFSILAICILIFIAYQIPKRHVSESVSSSADESIAPMVPTDIAPPLQNEELDEEEAPPSVPSSSTPPEQSVSDDQEKGTNEPQCKGTSCTWSIGNGWSVTVSDNGDVSYESANGTKTATPPSGYTPGPTPGSGTWSSESPSSEESTPSSVVKN